MPPSARSGERVFTRRRLLEWTPSADRAHLAGQGLAGAWARMWVAPALAAIVFVYLLLERPAGLAGRRARSAPVVRRPGHHVADQPAARQAGRAAHGRPVALPPRRRPQDVGLLRYLRRPGRPLAAAGQLPGVARSRAGAPHVADQHGAGAARQSLGLRLRLHLGGPARRPHHARLPGDVVDGTPPRPLLQLVRHAVARTARAAVHLLRGQRQPGRPPADAEARAARASRRPDSAAAHVPRAAPHAGTPGRVPARSRSRPP